ncbi:hypothetical protein GOODEAATRI_012602, partial [Goodea atripinnis]
PCLRGPTCWWWCRSCAGQSRTRWTSCPSSQTWSSRSTTSSWAWWWSSTQASYPSTPGERSSACTSATRSSLTSWIPSMLRTTC